MININADFTFNARNCMSWGGGSNITVNNSEFSHAGQPRYYADPGSGLDIEYESPGVGWGYPASHGRFNNCRFEYNSGFAMVSDSNTYKQMDHIFTNCTFIGFYSLQLGAKKFNFNHCNFVGTVASHHNEPVADSIQNTVNHYQTVFTDCDFNEEFDVPGFGRRSFQLTPEEDSIHCLVPGHLFLINALGARQEFHNCHTNTNYTMLDGFFHAKDALDSLIPYDSLNLPWFNKMRIRSVTMFNHGLNSCDCDHELSSMVNCDFVGTNNGNVLIAGNPNTFAGNRNSPHHGGPGEHSLLHFPNHHAYHGVAAGYNSYHIDPANHSIGNYWQTSPNFFIDMLPIVPKYNLSNNYFHRVNDLFTGYPPYMYSTINGIQSYCLDPIVPRKMNPDLINSGFNIYPNPATNSLTINNIVPGTLIKVVNFIGEILINEKSNNNTQELNIKEFPPGIYLIYIDNLPGKKFIKI